jgi:glyoxylase-like metal-dependent hydrolase (beta-lactamase superfamily II)
VAYQIVYPDETVVIDSAADRKSFEEMTPLPLKSFSEKNYVILQDALKSASLVMITHEHFDHVGGIATSPKLSTILPHLILTKEQLESPVIKDAGFPPAALDGFVAVTYDRYYRAAPGIVLIKAPGHTPGQQIIYVVTKGGREYLFIGDIVWNRENLTRAVNRPLLTSLVLREDRKAGGDEIRWIINNLAENPGNTVTYPISHDGQQLDEYIKAGVITEGFK